MASIEGGDRGQLEPLSDCDQAGVDAAEVLVGVVHLLPFFAAGCWRS